MNWKMMRLIPVLLVATCIISSHSFEAYSYLRKLLKREDKVDSKAETENAPRCPTTNDDDEAVKMMEHSKNCNEFYMCDNGRAILMQCPSDLFFNTKLNTCDYHGNMDCVAYKSSLQTAESRAKSAGENLLEGVKEEVNRCDSKEADNILMPDFDNCSVYYKCQDGQEKTLLCPSPQLFNPEEQNCVDPKTFDCKVRKPILYLTAQDVKTLTRAVKILESEVAQERQQSSSLLLVLLRDIGAFATDTFRDRAVSVLTRVDQVLRDRIQSTETFLRRLNNTLGVLRN